MMGRLIMMNRLRNIVEGQTLSLRCHIHNVHPGLIGKLVVDFLLALIELFRWVLQLRRYGRKKIEKRRFLSNAVSWTQNFR